MNNEYNENLQYAIQKIGTAGIDYSEAEIVRNIEVIVGLESATDRDLGHNTIPRLNELVTLRRFLRDNGLGNVPGFVNPILRNYEQDGDEARLWEAFERSARALNNA